MRYKPVILLCLFAALALLWFHRSHPPAEELIVRQAPAEIPETEIPIPVEAVTISRANPVATSETISRDEWIAFVSARLQEWDDDDNPQLREERLRELAGWLDGTNALEIVQALPPQWMGYVFAVPSFREKLLSDRQAALDWMAKNPNVQSQLLTFLSDWEQQNPDEMKQSLANLPEGEWKQQVLSAAVNEALSRDPANAIALASQMQPGSTQTEWLTMAATEWAKQNPAAAAQWANQIGSSDLRDRLLASVISGAAENDPQQALDFLARFPMTDTAFNQSVANATWAFALKDSNATANWISALPESLTQQIALENLMTVWGGHQPEAATVWVEGLPKGTLQLQAARDLYSVLMAQ
jgi:hypothetical protein